MSPFFRGLLSANAPTSGGGGGGNPGGVTDWLFDYDPGRMVGISDGTRIAQLDDFSGNGHHATQLDPTYRPVFEVDEWGTGLHTVRFGWTGSANAQTFFSCPNVLGSLAAGEIFIVLERFLDPPIDSAKTGLVQFGSSGNDTHYPWVDGNIYDTFGTPSRKTVGNPTPSLAARHVYNVVSSASEWTARLDGAVLFTTASNTVGWLQPKIGGYAVYYLDGRIARLLFIGRSLTTTERAAVLAALQAKYGTP